MSDVQHLYPRVEYGFFRAQVTRKKPYRRIAGYMKASNRCLTAVLMDAMSMPRCVRTQVLQKRACRVGEGSQPVFEHTCEGGCSRCLSETVAVSVDQEHGISCCQTEHHHSCRTGGVCLTAQLLQQHWSPRLIALVSMDSSLPRCGN